MLSHQSLITAERWELPIESVMGSPGHDPSKLSISDACLQQDQTGMSYADHQDIRTAVQCLRFTSSKLKG